MICASTSAWQPCTPERAVSARPQFAAAIWNSSTMMQDIRTKRPAIRIWLTNTTNVWQPRLMPLGSSPCRRLRQHSKFHRRPLRMVNTKKLPKLLRRLDFQPPGSSFTKRLPRFRHLKNLKFARKRRLRAVKLIFPRSGTAPKFQTNRPRLFLRQQTLKPSTSRRNP